MANDVAASVGLSSDALSDLPKAPDATPVGLPEWAGGPHVAPQQAASRAPVHSEVAASVGLSPTALSDLPPAPAEDQTKGVPLSSRVGAASSSMYGAVADVGNWPTYIANLASDTVENLGVKGGLWGHLKPPIDTNPLNYQPQDQTDRVIQGAGAAVGSIPGVMIGGELAAPALKFAGSIAENSPRLAGALETANRVSGGRVALTPQQVADGLRDTGDAAARYATLPDRAPVIAPVAATAAGASGQYAGEQVPEEYAPLVNTATQLLVGGGLGLGLDAAATGANYLGRKGVAPRTTVTGDQGNTVRGTPSQLREATEKVVNASGDPNALQVSINQPGSPVPDYDRTLSQQTQLPGIVSLEAPYRTAYAPEFSATDHTQANALAAHMQNAAPPDANPQSVGKMFTAKLDTLQADQAADRTRLGATVQSQTAGLGGTDDATSSGTTMAAAVNRQQAPLQATADQGVAAAQTARDQAIPPPNHQDIPGGATVAEQYGAEARGQAMVGRQATTDQEKSLWATINPDGTAGAQSVPFKSKVAAVYSAIPDSALPPSGEEANIVKTIASWPDLVPLTEVQAARERINTAISKEVASAGQTQTAVSRRLIATKQALDDALEGTLDATHAAQQQAVSAGQMSPEATLEARLRQQWGLAQATPASGATRPLTPEELQATREARAFSQQRARTFDEGAVGDILAPGEHHTAAQVPANVTRAKGSFAQQDAEVLGKLWNAKDTEAANLRTAQAAGISPKTLRDFASDDLRTQAVDENGNFDLKKYAQWRRDHAAGLHVFPEVKAAFDGVAKAQETLAARQAESASVAKAHPLADVQYASEVPSKYVRTGDVGADMTRQFVKDSGGDTGAMQAFDDSIVRKMRETPGVIKADGTIDPSKLDGFRSKYSGALSQRNELSGKLSNLADAQNEYDRVMSDHTARVADLQNGAAKHFLSDDPLNAVRKSFATGNPERTFRQLVDLVKGYPDATEGLKRAVADYLVDKFSSARPAGPDADFIKSGQFRAWMRHNRDALKTVFGGQGFNNFDQVAAELRRAAQSPQAAPGSPTAERLIGAKQQGLAGTKEHGGVGSVLTAIMGEHLFGKVGLLLGPAVKVVHSFRQAGISTTNDAVKAMLLHPDVTKALVAKYGPAQGSQYVAGSKLAPIAQNRVAAALQATLGGAISSALH